MTQQISQKSIKSKKEISFYLQQEETLDEIIGNLFKMKKNMKSFLNIKNYGHVCTKCGDKEIITDQEEVIKKSSISLIKHSKNIHKNIQFLSQIFQQAGLIIPSSKKDQEILEGSELHQDINKISDIIDQARRSYEQISHFRKEFLKNSNQVNPLLNSVKPLFLFPIKSQIKKPINNAFARPPKPRKSQSPQKQVETKFQTYQKNELKKQVKYLFQIQPVPIQERDIKIKLNPEESFYEYKYSDDEVVQEEYGLNFNEALVQTENLFVKKQSNKIMNQIRQILENKCQFNYKEKNKSFQVQKSLFEVQSKNQSSFTHERSYKITKQSNQKNSINNLGTIDNIYLDSPNVSPQKRRKSFQSLKYGKKAQSVLLINPKKQIQSPQKYFKFSRSSNKLNLQNDNPQQDQKVSSIFTKNIQNSNGQYIGIKVCIISKVRKDSFLFATPNKPKKRVLYQEIQHVYTYGSKLLELQVKDFGRVWAGFQQKDDRQKFCGFLL